MKRIFALITVLCLCLSLCACKNSNSKTSSEVSSSLNKNENVSSSINETEQKTPALTFADSEKAYFEIVYKGSEAPAVISNKQDYEFIKNYNYAYNITGEQEKVLSSFPDKSVINFITEDGDNATYYLLEDGKIMEQQANKDSAAAQTTFYVFTANKEDILTKEKLTQLINKYNTNKPEEEKKLQAEIYKAVVKYLINVSDKSIEKTKSLTTSDFYNTIKADTEDSRSSCTNKFLEYEFAGFVQVTVMETANEPYQAMVIVKQKTPEYDEPVSFECYFDIVKENDKVLIDNMIY